MILEVLNCIVGAPENRLL